jgi:hypothetical protein
MPEIGHRKIQICQIGQALLSYLKILIRYTQLTVSSSHLGNQDSRFSGSSVLSHRARRAFYQHALAVGIYQFA